MAPFAWIAADVNNDGLITTADNIQIQKLILGQITNFLDVPAWRFVPSFALQNQVFLSEFNSDPFSAIWTTSSGEYLGYNQAITGGTKTYFDDLVINLRHPNISQISTFSLEAIKSGDVNFSAAINLSEPEFNAPELRTNEKYRLQNTETNCLEHGKTYAISISAQGDNSIYGYQMGVNFDPNILNVSGVGNGQVKHFSIDDFNLNNLGKGELKTAWLDIKTSEKVKISEKKELFKMFVTAQKRVCNLDQVLYLNDRTLENLFYDENGRLMNLQLFADVQEIKKEDSDNLLLNLYPNPASNEVNFEINVQSKTKIDITLQDNFGKTISVKKSVEPGISKVTIDKEMSSLSKGIIYYSLTIGTKLYSGTFFTI